MKVTIQTHTGSLRTVEMTSEQFSKYDHLMGMAKYYEDNDMRLEWFNTFNEALEYFNKIYTKW